jgi:uncharacterized membrane protein HdeD (DUF308 family)
MTWQMAVKLHLVIVGLFFVILPFVAPEFAYATLGAALTIAGSLNLTFAKSSAKRYARFRWNPLSEELCYYFLRGFSVEMLIGGAVLLSLALFW